MIFVIVKYVCGRPSRSFSVATLAPWVTYCMPFTVICKMKQRELSQLYLILGLLAYQCGGLLIR